MHYALQHDIGARKAQTNGINEDSVTATIFEEGHRDASRTAGVFVLADGAGGSRAGDVASYLATTIITDHLTTAMLEETRATPDQFDLDLDTSLDVIPSPATEDELHALIRDAITHAHHAILQYAQQIRDTVHTTVVAGVCLDSTFHYGWVGDSRAYVVNTAAEQIDRLTKDHSQVEALRDAGDIDPIEAYVHPQGHAITEALGGTQYEDPDTTDLTIDTHSVDLFADDVVLLTSDGLLDAATNATQLYQEYQDADNPTAVAEKIRNTVVTDEDIRDGILRADSLDAAADHFIDLSNDRGGKDNISVILFRDSAFPVTPSPVPNRTFTPETPIEDRQTLLHPQPSEPNTNP